MEDLLPEAPDKTHPWREAQEGMFGANRWEAWRGVRGWVSGGSVWLHEGEAQGMGMEADPAQGAGWAQEAAGVKDSVAAAETQRLPPASTLPPPMPPSPFMGSAARLPLPL